MARRRSVVLGSYPDSVVAFRGDLIGALVDAGDEVTVMTADCREEVRESIEKLGGKEERSERLKERSEGLAASGEKEDRDEKEGRSEGQGARGKKEERSEGLEGRSERLAASGEKEERSEGLAARSEKEERSDGEIGEEKRVAFRPYWVQRNGLSVRSDWRTLNELKQTFRELQPDVILAYTIKPVIWGGIAARKVPNARFYALITGLGYAFQGNSLKRRLLSAAVVRLYRFALKRAEGVIFQNTDNRDEFLKRKIVPAEKCHVVSGSGINVERFATAPIPDGSPRFLLIARLLGEKGIREYVHAAREVKKIYPDAVFDLVGPSDPSPDGIPLAEVRAWHDERVIVYHGPTDNVQPFLNRCHVYCLPSYHEGMPRTVLEAMAMGRPILTTNTSGCKETVEDGINGWKVPVADANALAKKMIWFLENRQAWVTMGIASRQLAEKRFDVKLINAEMLRIMGS